MKKIIIITLLVVSIAFLFSGCDAILEAMFPDATGQGGNSGTNQINLSVSIDQGIPDWWQHKVYAEIVGVNGTEFYDNRSNYANADNQDSPAYVDFFFDFLPNGDYQVNVWLDNVEDNGWADEGEPFAQVMTDSGNIFSMPYPNPDNPAETFSTMKFDVQLGTMNIGEEPWLLMGNKVISYDNRTYANNYIVQPVIKDHSTNNFKWYIWDGVKDQDGDVSSADNFAFNFDKDTTEGPYWIDISNLTINLPDGNRIDNLEDSFMVKVVDDATIDGKLYKLNLSSWGFDGPPFYLDYNTDYGVKVEVYDGVGTSLGSHVYNGELSNGGFDLTSDGVLDIGKNGDGSLTYNAAATGPVDYVRVFVDVDGNGSFTDDGDLATQFEVGIMSTDAHDETEAHWWSDNSIDPRRYILYSDFIRLF